ncbi:Wadjet anti-phage system protein JetD domain-containing protein [Robertmurraya andreesenii]|uniref:Wadjet protein JetD C-terminal domain-containing protein n=1 Tax=Anoxybacillus andreesenii TaxID=1325932 RepID=A0ABT9V990_9BACL|nr:Wadjet anti-phage system protein JetD domain-containing protein [Robertmurraya andreesenii]MDQ0157395.1 hypothetical protein [Robertmurraya andreesenii]
MNSLNNTPSSKHRHKLKYINEWGTWKKKNGLHIREKIRYSVCENCSYHNKLRTHEIETVGLNKRQINPSQFLTVLEIKVAKIILKDLYKSGNKKRWSSWKETLYKKWSFTIIEKTMDKLHTHGFLIKRQKKDPSRINQWDIHHVYYNEKMTESIEAFLGINSKKIFHWEENPFPPLVPPSSNNAKTLSDLIYVNQKHHEHSSNYVIEGVDKAKMIFPRTSKGVYLKLIRGIWGLYQLSNTGRQLYLKEFSQEFFHDTKTFTKSDRDKLDKIVNGVERFGLYQARNEVLISGAFQWKWNGTKGNSLAIKGYLPLPRDMIAEMEITQWAADKLLIVENQDLFINIAKRNLLNNNDWAILFGSGYISSEEEIIISEAVKLGLKCIYFWCDLDPYGFLIADHFQKKANLPIPIYLFGFNTNWFSKLSIYKELTKIDKEELQQLLNEDLPFQIKELLFLMKETGYKGEQEFFSNLIKKSTFEKEVVAESIRLS